eukprot:TRINITY_DN16031_c0_g1_i1.p1 TRINITY_DN16031_c0_g1~~TRINITY_DN16031_c0_g1_i1.p1  ORF type:complete len:118 (-),score=21.56 TRINITY_DN16031_c0_g1_i1:184-537(-)
MASKIIANLLVLGGGILVRAISQAYRQAIINGTKAGVAEQVKNTVGRGSKTMSLHEARQILGIKEEASWEDIIQRYERLYQRNEEGGSFYIQSKVVRAKEALEVAQQQAKDSAGGKT